jgi:hypothetical protein
LTYHKFIVGTGWETTPPEASTATSGQLFVCQIFDAGVEAYEVLMTPGITGYVGIAMSRNYAYSVLNVARIASVTATTYTKETYDLAAFAPLASPALTGTPTAPTPALP